MQLPLSDTRAVRMLQALLAAADPLGRLERGEPQHTYDALAVAILARLREGARAQDLVVLLHEHAAGADPAARLGPVVAFSSAAADWWVNAEGRWAPPSIDFGATHGEYGKVVTA